MAEEGRVSAESEPCWLISVINEIFTSPINLILVGIIALLVHKIFKHKTKVQEPAPVEPELPKIKRDFTVQQLKQYDGNGPDKRILMAVNGSVYDVTRGRRFYGPGKFSHLASLFFSIQFLLYAFLFTNIILLCPFHGIVSIHMYTFTYTAIAGPRYHCMKRWLVLNWNFYLRSGITRLRFIIQSIIIFRFLSPW